MHRERSGFAQSLTRPNLKTVLALREFLIHDLGKARESRTAASGGFEDSPKIPLISSRDLPCATSSLIFSSPGRGVCQPLFKFGFRLHPTVPRHKRVGV